MIEDKGDKPNVLNTRTKLSAFISLNEAKRSDNSI